MASPVSLLDVSTYLPGEPIGVDYYEQFAGSDDLRDNLMFRAPRFRHHVAPMRPPSTWSNVRAPGLDRAARTTTPSRVSTC